MSKPRLNEKAPARPKNAAREHESTSKVGARKTAWFLDSSVAGGLNRIPLERFPFRIGRRRGLDLRLASRSVSSYHAEINLHEQSGQLRVRDLGSTNGTFVNHTRTRDDHLREGDILHIADVEFRVGCDPSSVGDVAESGQTLRFGKNKELSNHFFEGTLEFVELMRREMVTTVFQPVVRLPDRSIEGYEALARGRHPGLPDRPKDLFRIASGLGLASELSRLFRKKALEAIGKRDDLPTVFLNTHPDEDVQDLIRLAPKLREIAPNQPLVLEIHERALADPASIGRLRTKLAKSDVGIAFDDFGAGEARVVQLAEEPPDYLKFDITFIQDIDKSPPSKRHLLSSIVSAAHDLGVKSVAEGIETDAEAEVCAEIGFTHAQGYLFGRAVSVDDV
jgi:EAL domain-containing protein (putative c-di-GMP-specific phosphodiesterase class I)